VVVVLPHGTHPLVNLVDVALVKMHMVLVLEVEIELLIRELLRLIKVGLAELAQVRTLMVVVVEAVLVSPVVLHREMVLVVSLLVLVVAECHYLLSQPAT
tara:strand:+ start:286 stop:585 length:300 start_codon:yes stop_codon:yes gene_type:complete